MFAHARSTHPGVHSPPPYSSPTVSSHGAAPTSSERTPLINSRSRSQSTKRVVGWAAYTLAAIFLLFFWSVISEAAHQFQRHSWQREIEEHEHLRMEMGIQQSQWKFELRSLEMEHVQLLERIQSEKDQWAEEKRTWQQERDALKPFWGAPRRVSDRCLTYGTREYTARLYNVLHGEPWQVLCKNTPIEIHDREVPAPDRCEDRGLDEGIWGFWRIKYGELDCEPTWEVFWDMGCHSRGMKRWESILWNIRERTDDDYYEMCRSTPVTLPDGYHFETAHCEDRRNWGPRDRRGFIGKWEVPDDRCE